MIQINDDWRIDHDPYSLVLQNKKKVKTKGTGEEREEWVIEGYYPTYKVLLSALVNKKVRRCKTVEEITKTVEEIHTMIENLDLSKFR